MKNFSEWEIIEQIIYDLNKMLGQNYTLGTQVFTGGYQADLVVVNNSNLFKTVFEFKGSKNDELPYGILQIIRNIYKILPKENCKLVLVSFSYVPKQIESLIEKEKVSLIKYTSYENLLKSIKQAIE